MTKQKIERDKIMIMYLICRWNDNKQWKKDEQKIKEIDMKIHKIKKNIKKKKSNLALSLCSPRTFQA